MATTAAAPAPPKAKAASTGNKSKPSSAVVGPVWMQEEEQRRIDSPEDEDVIFLRERGHTMDEAREALRQNSSRQHPKSNRLHAALKSLFLPSSVACDGRGDDGKPHSDEATQEARREEREVLQAIFGGGEGHDNDDEDGAQAFGSRGPTSPAWTRRSPSPRTSRRTGTGTPRPW